MKTWQQIEKETEQRGFLRDAPDGPPQDYRFTDAKEALAIAKAGVPVRPDYWGPWLTLVFREGKLVTGGKNKSSRGGPGTAGKDLLDGKGKWMVPNADVRVKRNDFISECTEGDECGMCWKVVARRVEADKPASPTKPKSTNRAGQWFCGKTQTWLAIAEMTDKHLDSALSYLELKRKDLEAEQKKRATRAKPIQGLDTIIALQAGKKLGLGPGTKGYYRHVAQGGIVFVNSQGNSQAINPADIGFLYTGIFYEVL